MNKSMKLATGLSLSAMLLAGCGSDVSESKDINVDPVANLYLSFRNSVGNVPMDSVNVTLVRVDKASRQADDQGTLSYSKLQVGSYTMLVERSGYASLSCPVSITMAATDETPIANDQAMVVNMHKLGVTVQGVAKQTQPSGTIVALEDATIKLSIANSPCTFIDNFKLASTDESGLFTFENLPENASYSITAQAMVDGNNVYVDGNSYSVSNKLSGEVAVLTSVFNYRISTQAFVLESINTDTLGINDDIILSFSKSIDETALRSTSIKVTRNGETLAITKTLSNSNATLTISPAVGSWWANGAYAVIVDLKSVEGQSLTRTENFTIYNDGSLGNVAGLTVSNTQSVVYSDGVGSTMTKSADTNKVDARTVQMDLTWNKLANVTTYEVYEKRVGDSTYILVDELADTTTTITTTDYFIKSQVIDYVVVGVNSAGRSSFETATKLSLSDKIRPSIVEDLTNWVIDPLLLDNSAGTAPDTLDAYGKTFVFSEIMDSTEVPVITLTPSGESTLMTYFVKWENKYSFTVYPIVKTGQDASVADHSVSVDLSTLNDVAGNVVTPSSYVLAFN